MSLSSDLVSQFVKATNDNTKAKKEASVVYGTVTQAGDQTYVKLDGSDISTPVTTAATVKTGDRVIVSIKNHSAVITGNVKDPSASNSEVENNKAEADSKITELGVAVADRITVEQLNANNAVIKEELLANDVKVQNTLTASIVEVERKLTAKDVEITGKLDANEASIRELYANSLTVESAQATYATIKNLEATNAEVNSLKATHAEFKQATIDDLKANICGG